MSEHATLIVVRTYNDEIDLGQRLPPGFEVMAYTSPPRGRRFDTIVIAISHYEPSFAWHTWYDEQIMTIRRDLKSLVIGMSADALAFSQDVFRDRGR